MIEKIVTTRENVVRDLEMILYEGYMINDIKLIEGWSPRIELEYQGFTLEVDYQEVEDTKGIKVWFGDDCVAYGQDDPEYTGGFFEPYELYEENPRHVFGMYNLFPSSNPCQYETVVIYKENEKGE